MSFITDIRDYLVAASTNLQTGSSTGSSIPVFISRMPADGPDTMVSMIPSGGPGPLYTHQGSMAITRPSFQVIVRSSGRERAHELALQIHDTLGTVTNLTLPSSSGAEYLTITPMQFPADMGDDSLERPLVTCNYLVERPA